MSEEGDALNMVQVRGLVKRYGPFRLGPLDLQVPAGYVVGLIGPNGAGKSTLLKMLMNLVQPDAGEIELFGRSYAQSEREIKERIGFVPEEPFLYPQMDPAWLGRFASAYYPSWSEGRYRSLLGRFGVDPRLPVQKLSRGTKVKVELALALAHAPELLILDEPISGLDPLVRRELLQELTDVVQDEKRSVLFSSHITEDVERVADYVAFLVEGRLALVAEREALRESWQELWLDGPVVDGLPGVVRREESGRAWRVWVSQARETVETLHRHGRAPFRRRALELDEVLQVLAEGGEPGSASPDGAAPAREVARR